MRRNEPKKQGKRENGERKGVEGYLGIEDRERRVKQKVPHARTRTHTSNMPHKTMHTLLAQLAHITPKLGTATPGKTQRETQREQKM